MRPYGWVRAILRNTDAILRLGTCEGSKNCPVFVPFGDACGAYAIRPYDWIRVALQKTILFSSPSGPSVGYMRYAPTTGYVRSFEIPMQCPNRVCAILRNTDAILQLDTCDSSKYRCDSPTGYVRSFEIPMGSLDRRGGDFWEVGRWGLPLAEETGVNEFGEEEDDDQNNDNKGA